MRKRVSAAVLLLALLLSVTACGSGGSAGGETKTPETASQPAQGPGEATSQPTEEAGKETPAQTEEPAEPPQPTEGPAAVSYIFSDRPVAAFEVTGLGVGHLIDVNRDYGLVKLTPGENSFIIFCMQAEFEALGDYSVATIRSPAGTGLWEAMRYLCLDVLIDPMPEDCAPFFRGEYPYSEADRNGCYKGMLDAALHWISFSELYHPDAARNDSICVVDVAPFPGFPGLDTIEGVVAAVADTFNELGATVTQIPVDEAMAKCHVEVS